MSHENSFGIETFTDSERAIIMRALQQIGVRSSCPMCLNRRFILSPGYTCNADQDLNNGKSNHQWSIPTISIICNKCGFVSQHSAAILDHSKNENER